VTKLAACSDKWFLFGPEGIDNGKEPHEVKGVEVHGSGSSAKALSVHTIVSLDARVDGNGVGAENAQPEEPVARLRKRDVEAVEVGEDTPAIERGRLCEGTTSDQSLKSAEAAAQEWFAFAKLHC
jgi:hypothetical protein